MDNTGQWTLRMFEGAPDDVQSPLEETEDGCMEMRNGIHRATGYRTFVVGVLILTDTPRNEQMEHAARERHHVYIVWDWTPWRRTCSASPGRLGSRCHRSRATRETSRAR